MNLYLNETQKRTLAKLSSKWCTAASIRESMMTLDALAKRDLAEYKFLKYEVVWRRKV